MSFQLLGRLRQEEGQKLKACLGYRGVSGSACATQCTKCEKRAGECSSAIEQLPIPEVLDSTLSPREEGEGREGERKRKERRILAFRTLGS